MIIEKHIKQIENLLNKEKIIKYEILQISFNIACIKFELLNKNNRTKDLGLKTHAWFNVYYLWSSKKHPAHNDHLLFQKPDWLDQRKKDKYISNKKFLNNVSNLFFSTIMFITFDKSSWLIVGSLIKL